MRRVAVRLVEMRKGIFWGRFVLGLDCATGHNLEMSLLVFGPPAPKPKDLAVVLFQGDRLKGVTNQHILELPDHPPVNPKAPTVVLVVGHAACRFFHGRRVTRPPL